VRSAGWIALSGFVSGIALVLISLAFAGVGIAGATGVPLSERMNAPPDWPSETKNKRDDSRSVSPSSILAQGLLVCYQTVFSPASPQQCPMSPSCSQYARDSFASYRFFTAVVMTCDRLLRCGHDLRFYPSPERPTGKVPDAAQ
jgi:putative component of membrane protein insertase Oxa1/YidC/SpoIIIJ protein YidD